MDDLKLYAKDEADLDKLINVVSVFSRDIGMEFGLDKCAVLVMKRDIKARCEGIQLPDGRVDGGEVGDCGGGIARSYNTRGVDDCGGGDGSGGGDGRDGDDRDGVGVGVGVGV